MLRFFRSLGRRFRRISERLDIMHQRADQVSPVVINYLTNNHNGNSNDHDDQSFISGIRLYITTPDGSSYSLDERPQDGMDDGVISENSSFSSDGVAVNSSQVLSSKSVEVGPAGKSLDNPPIDYLTYLKQLQGNIDDHHVYLPVYKPFEETLPKGETYMPQKNLVDKQRAPLISDQLGQPALNPTILNTNFRRNDYYW